MLNFLLHLWFWLIVSFCVGAGAGLLTRRAPAGAVARWLIWTGLAALTGAAAVGLDALPGRAGLYLESALATLLAFLAGAALATLAAGRSLRQHEGWALGLIPAALVWWGATLFAAPAWQDDLRSRLAALTERAGFDAAALTVAGHDVGAPPDIAADKGVMDAIAATPGVRRVFAAPAVSRTAATIAPKAPAEEGAREPQVVVESPPPPPPAANVAPQAVARESLSMSLEKARAVLAALPAGLLERAACQAALVAVTTLDPIRFREAGVAIHRGAALALDHAAALIRRCASATIEVAGRADNVGDAVSNLALSQRRAEAAADYLRREGVGDHRLVAVGLGADAPLASNDDPEGRAANRSVSLIVE